MTNRELYFEEIGKHDKYMTKTLILQCLCAVNGFESTIELYNKFDSECQNTETFFYYREMIKKGYPFQYLVKAVQFYAMALFIDERVLIPRPETEELVYKTIERVGITFPEDKKLSILDLGTGSGCIALAMKKQFPTASVDALDISSAAIEVAQINAKKLGLNISLINGDMLQPSTLTKKYDVIVSNPPYIGKESEADSNVRKHEPHEALFADPAIKYYKAILENYAVNIHVGTLLAFEISPKIKKELINLVKIMLPTSRYWVEKDIYHKTRFLFVDVNDPVIDIEGINKTLEEHNIVCFPTETVMGLGICAGDKQAYDNLVALKGREDDKPFTLMLWNKKDISKYAKINDTAKIIINEYMPGPITLLLPLKKASLNKFVNNTKVIGVRVPGHKVAIELLEAVSKPMFVTSANKSGEKPATKVKGAKEIFGDSLFYVEGDAEGNKPSIVLDVTSDTIKVVREGDKELLKEIKARIGQ
ncbi:MAG: peptide chain release factor N(5)-glutamine methyltransferase [Coprobacillus sp.]|nr:peptide chain release factor N(5)-glutamine methyltransferase [Coprobacillus sp.]